MTTPFHPNFGGGTYGLQLGAGGGQTEGTSDAEAGIVLVQNPNAFKTGILFQAGSLTGDTQGDGHGAGVAVSMAPGHLIKWCTNETVQNVKVARAGFTIQSQVTQADLGSRVIILNASFNITNAQGLAVFAIGIPQEPPTNILCAQSGSGQQAAGLYVQAGPDGSSNLALYPAAGGELQITSPVVESGAKLSQNDVPAGGWLHININGSDLRVPLFSPEQAGG